MRTKLSTSIERVAPSLAFSSDFFGRAIGMIGCCWSFSVDGFGRYAVNDAQWMLSQSRKRRFSGGDAQAYVVGEHCTVVRSDFLPKKKREGWKFGGQESYLKM